MSAEIDQKELLQKLKEEPLFLVKIIALNNPEDVGAGLQGLGIGGGSYTPEEIIDALREAVYNFSPKEITEVLTVRFNDAADNETATYLEPLRAYAASMAAMGEEVALNWGVLFKDTIAKFSEASADFDGKSIKKSKKKPCTDCGSKTKDTDHAKIIAIAVLAVCAFLIIKHWK